VIRRWAWAALLVNSLASEPLAAAPGSDGGAPSQAQSRVLRSRASEQRNVRPPPEMAVFLPPEPTPPQGRGRRRDGPDERPLWWLLEQGEFALVVEGIDQVKARYPSWSPPEKLTTMVQDGLLRARIRDAAKDGRAPEVFAQRKARPDLFSCDQVDMLWALALAHLAIDQRADAAEVYIGVARTCVHDDDRLAALYEARALLTRDAFAKLIFDDSIALRSSAAKGKLARMRYDFRMEDVSSSYQRKDYRTAAAGVEDQDAGIAERQDVAAATLAGWTYFHLEDWTRTERWLRRALDWQPAAPDPRYLLSLTWYRAGRLDEARAAAAAMPEDTPRRRELLGNVIMNMAHRSYQVKDYAGTLSLISEAEEHGKAGPEVDRLRAWSHYHLGEYGVSAKQFAELYRKTPDDDLAEGLVQSHVRAGRREEALKLGPKLGGPLRRRTSHLRAQQLQDSKLFVAAHAVAPDRDPQTQGMLSPRLAVYSAARRKEGGGGFGNLDLFKFVMIEGTAYPRGSHEIQLRVDGLLMRAEHPGQNATVGRVPLLLLPGDYPTPPVIEERAWEPRLGWRHEAEVVTPFAEVGTTPIGAVLQPRPTWRLGAALAIPRGGLEAQFRGQPVRDSLLSYVGTIDPYSGETWGRVHTAGASLWGYFAPISRITTSWRGVAERLDGEDVQTNTHLGVGVSAGVVAKWRGFDQLSAGPYVDIDRYTHNVGFTTFGHGGYFSPRLFLRAGLYADLLTAELRSFIVKARVSGGVSRKEEDFSDFFPLAPDGREYVALIQTAVEHSVEALAAVALGKHLQLGGAFLRRNRLDYNDLMGLLVLRGSWEARGALVSRDLPTSALADMY